MALLSNSLGADLLSGVVTQATFHGLPVVVCGNALAYGSPRWEAALQLEAIRATGIPLIGVSLDSAALAADLAQLAYACRRVSRFLGPGGRPLIWSDNRTFARQPPVCGPWLCLPQTDGTYDSEITAAVAATRGFLATRIGDATFYGNLAVGTLSTLYGPTAGDVYSRPHAPAVYRSNYPRSGDSYAADVRTILTLWQAGAQPTLEQYQTLQTLSLTYPGIQTRVPAFLVDWVVPTE